MNSHPFIHKSLSRELNDDVDEIEDDIILDVVNIISQIYWENKPEWESVNSFNDIPYILYIYNKIYIHICVVWKIRKIEIDIKRQSSHQPPQYSIQTFTTKIRR